MYRPEKFPANSEFEKHIDYFINLPDDLVSHIVLVGFAFMVKFRTFISCHPQHSEDDITSGVYGCVRDGQVAFDGEIVPIENNEKQKQIAVILRS